MEQREREARGMAEESDPSANPGSTHYAGTTSTVYCHIQDTAHTGYSGAAIPGVGVVGGKVQEEFLGGADEAEWQRNAHRRHS